jgi:hypothetical protein
LTNEEWNTIQNIINFHFDEFFIKHQQMNIKSKSLINIDKAQMDRLFVEIKGTIERKIERI